MVLHVTNSLPPEWVVLLLSIAVAVSTVVILLLCGVCDQLMKSAMKLHTQHTRPKIDLNKIKTFIKLPKGLPRNIFKTKPVLVQTPIITTTAYDKKKKNLKKMYAAAAVDTETNKEECFGWIQFHVVSSKLSGELKVTVINGLSLPARDVTGTSDPFCLLVLYPQNHKLSTKVIARNLNPVWNETLMFQIDEDLNRQTLYLFVLDEDWLKKDDLIGETSIAFEEDTYAQGKTLWLQLEPSIGPVGDYGELYFSMQYNFKEKSLVLNVLRARNLPPMDMLSKSSDSYVKVDWLMKGQRYGKHKTRVMERDLNPIFQQSFAFGMTRKQLKQSYLLLTVKDYDKVGRNEVIGQVMLGVRGGREEREHWQQMMDCGEETTPRWHAMRRN